MNDLEEVLRSKFDAASVSIADPTFDSGVPRRKAKQRALRQRAGLAATIIFVGAASLWAIRSGDQPTTIETPAPNIVASESDGAEKPATPDGPEEIDEPSSPEPFGSEIVFEDPLDWSEVDAPFWPAASRLSGTLSVVGGSVLTVWSPVSGMETIVLGIDDFNALGAAGSLEMIVVWGTDSEPLNWGVEQTAKTAYFSTDRGLTWKELQFDDGVLPERSGYFTPNWYVGTVAFVGDTIALEINVDPGFDFGQILVDEGVIGDPGELEEIGDYESIYGGSESIEIRINGESYAFSLDELGLTNEQQAIAFGNGGSQLLVGSLRGDSLSAPSFGPVDGSEVRNAVVASSGDKLTAIVTDGRVVESVDGRSWTGVTSEGPSCLSLASVRDALVCSSGGMSMSESPPMVSGDGGSSWTLAFGSDRLQGEWTVTSAGILFHGQDIGGTTNPEDSVELVGYSADGLTWKWYEVAITDDTPANLMVASIIDNHIVLIRMKPDRLPREVVALVAELPTD